MALLKRADRALRSERLIEERGFACMVELLLKLAHRRRADGRDSDRLALRSQAQRQQDGTWGGNTLRLLRKMVDWRVHGLN